MTVEMICTENRCGTTPADRSGLKAKRLRRVLTSSVLHSEINHLLQRPPRELDGRLDAGSMCRDSALLVATIAARLGADSTICTGEAAIYGPVQGTGQTCLHFKTHAWTDVAGYGICDFSPDLRTGAFPGWRDLPVRYLSGSRYYPAGEYVPTYHVRDETSFTCTRQTFESDSPGFHAVYLEKTRIPFDNHMFVGAVNFAQSPLIQDLSRENFFSLDLLGKAALHVWRVIKLKTPTLTTVNPDQVWPLIAQIDSGAVEKFRLLLRLADATFG